MVCCCSSSHLGDTVTGEMAQPAAAVAATVASRGRGSSSPQQATSPAAQTSCHYPQPQPQPAASAAAVAAAPAANPRRSCPKASEYGQTLCRSSTTTHKHKYKSYNFGHLSKLRRRSSSNSSSCCCCSFTRAPEGTTWPNETANATSSNYTYATEKAYAEVVYINNCSCCSRSRVSSSTGSSTSTLTCLLEA